MAAIERAEQEFSNPSGLMALWFGLLGGPLAWALSLEANFVLVRFTCQTRREWPLYFVTLLGLLITLSAGLLAWRNWRRAGSSWPDDTGGVLARRRFMSAGGILVSVLFFLVILAQG